MVAWTGSRRRPAPSSSSEDDHGGLTWTAKRRNAYLTSFTRTAPRQVENADGPPPSEAVIGVGERSGQLRPYVRPAARRLPLAIMGARARQAPIYGSVLGAQCSMRRRLKLLD